jgi:pilus assembly protein CpaE
MFMRLPDKLNAFADEQRERLATNAPRVAIVDGAVSAEQMAGLANLFPNVVFESVGAIWPERPIRSPGILIIALDAAMRDDIDRAIERLKSRSPTPVVVVLRHADVMVTRALIQAGAEDVLPTPVSDAALALCIDRILRNQTSNREPGKSGQVIALLKAGGGVGATSLGVQVASMLARKAGKPGQVCFADFDLQFGTGALYFDIADGLTVADCLAVGDFLGETQFATALAEHKSGVRVLAAPREPTALDILTPHLTEALINGLRRDFAYTILDLPSVWTAWTNRALQFADRIVLVTHLSVPHMHLVRRQLAVLSMQKMDEIPLTLVCNSVTSEQQDMLSIRAAERAIQRKIDILMPEDSRLMGASTNQGLELSTVRRGTKLEKAIGLVADVLAANTLASVRR